MDENLLSTRYDAAENEAKWYLAWESAGLFQPDPNPNKPKYCITIPPPNITGSLHMGHALCYPLQDVYGRYKRLTGYSVLILPGQDHAGIAAQGVVTRQLKQQGISAASLGREAFVEKVKEWRVESGGMILRQLRRFGCAFDWTRERYTLDEAYADTVLKIFIDWYKRGFIYRGKRVINWDPVLKTSVSDIETERKLIQGKLYHVRYPFADGSGHVTIATTRPETMLADVAVAVHPSDKRYEGLVGKNLVLPLMKREIPLIADTYPDPEFGTGAVKITPAHDPNDYEVGIRHGLDMPVILDQDAKVTALGGPYQGLDRYEARKRIVADLEEQGFLVKIEDHEIAAIVSERTKEVIEPLLSEQWFARQSELAQAAIQVVETDQIQFTPARYKQIYLSWMESIRDWNISRQLWWGHRIPIYYGESGKPYAAMSWEEAQAEAGEDKIVSQDPDVLDTWFSSGLWPFATLGWPESTKDLQEFYPTQTLITDRNILYLWVARMIMMGMDLVKAKPFSNVMIYATVLTEDGKRMSKSLGTGVDPMGIIDQVGADALRWALLSQTGENQDLRFGAKKTEEARNFCNKIWNASRFILMNAPKGKPGAPGTLEEVDMWLLGSLYRTETAVRQAYEAFDLQTACACLQKFFWSDLCDWYIEVSKSRMTDPAKSDTPIWILLTALEAFLIMLHPVMPHLSEELYSHLPIPSKAPFLMSAQWPELPKSFEYPDSASKIARAFEITRALRALRAELGLAAMKPVPVATFEGDLSGVEEIVRTQAWVQDLRPGKPDQPHVSVTMEGVDLHLPVEGLVDPEKEGARLKKEEEKLRAEAAKLSERLSDAFFMEKAKPEVVEREKARAEELQGLIAKNLERQKLFGLSA